jgi:hypothetical protein
MSVAPADGVLITLVKGGQLGYAHFRVIFVDANEFSAILCE